MYSRFTRPETKTLPLSDGDSIVVRRRLTWGEQSAAYERMYGTGLDGELTVNRLKIGMAKVSAYLVDWSLKEDDGTPVPIRGKPIPELIDVLNALDPEMFNEIRLAINAHEATMAAERQAEKNGPDGGTASSRTLPSPDAAIGDTSGSGI